MNNDLKPCPFCGSKAEIVTNDVTVDSIGLRSHVIYVDVNARCSKCYVRKTGRTVLNFEDGRPVISQDGCEIAVKEWNKRAYNE